MSWNNWSEQEMSRQVWSLMAKGLAPSKIDERLGMPKGMAHDVVVNDWARRRMG